MIKIKILNIDNEFKKLNKDAKAKMRAKNLVLTEILKTELANATPVDTGLAKNSWILYPNIYGAATIENNVEYINRLNEGSSKQAPAHFIERIALKYGTPAGAVVDVK